MDVLRVMQNNEKKTITLEKSMNSNKNREPDGIKIVLIAGKQVARSKIKVNIIRK